MGVTLSDSSAIEKDSVLVDDFRSLILQVCWEHAQSDKCDEFKSRRAKPNYTFTAYRWAQLQRNALNAQLG